MASLDATAQIENKQIRRHRGVERALRALRINLGELEQCIHTFAAIEHGGLILKSIEHMWVFRYNYDVSISKESVEYVHSLAG